MKKLLTYLVLYAYVVSLVKPVVPIISDLIAHTFYQLEHISVVHQHNGVYHVDKELEEASKDFPETNATNFKFDKDITAHVGSNLVYESQNFNGFLVHRPTYVDELSDEFTFDCFPPPKPFAE